MCRPTFYDVKYSINPWMNFRNSVDSEKAQNQWQLLVSKIESLGANVLVMDGDPEFPDLVFTANAGITLKINTIIPARFLHPERQGEEPIYQKWFKANDYSFCDPPEVSFEGAGDALYFGQELVGAHGFRSDPRIYEGWTETVVRLVDPYFYHLDTCFCPLKNGDYLIWDGAFDENSLKKIEKLGGQKISVPENEARSFVCNAVLVGDNVILPSGCEKTMEELKEKGYTPHPVDMSEFIKAGGACKCLTLELPKRFKE